MVGSIDELLTLPSWMQCAGIKPNSVSVVSICQCSKLLLNREKDSCLHHETFSLGTDQLVGSTLVHTSASYGLAMEVEMSFANVQTLSRLDVIVWNAIISVYPTAADI